jgi:hypothetical protein
MPTVSLTSCRHPVHALGRPSLWLVLGVMVGLAQPTRGDDLDKQLLKQAPQLIQKLQAKGYKNVGVLKFRIKKGDEPISDRAGLLNLDVAQRLELALVLAVRPQEPLGIIRNASREAAKTPGASHLSSEGRKQFFNATYPLVWGDAKVQADAFVTGVVEVVDDLKQLRVSLGVFDRGAVLEKLSQFTAAMDSQRLADVGESFVVRGVHEEGEVEQVALNDASQVHQASSQNPHPAVAPDAPVELLITYDAQPVPVEVRQGKAFVREPNEGQRVALTLRRKNAADPRRYACVLKVNGQNTLHKERARDIQCHKWVLEPNAPPIAITGYQLSDNRAEAFRVLSKAASQARQMDYGEDLGTISLVVFTERRGSVPGRTNLLDEDAEDLAALTRGVYPDQPAENLAALQAQLRANSRRGLIAEGETVAHEIRAATFDPAATPVMSTTIIYYRP